MTKHIGKGTSKKNSREYRLFRKLSMEEKYFEPMTFEQLVYFSQTTKTPNDSFGRTKVIAKLHKLDN